jgi:hypothetical protein
MNHSRQMLIALVSTFLTLVAVSSCLIAFAIKVPKEILINKSYISNNQTFQSFEPLYKIELKKGETFQWDNWIIEVK